jgi:hypothetical protein
MDQSFRHEWAPCHFKQLVYVYSRLSGSARPGATYKIIFRAASDSQI